MRKLRIAAAAAAAVASRWPASPTPPTPTWWTSPSGGPGNKAGSASKPIPVFLNFGYEVGDSENLRLSVINQYYIAV